MMRQITVGLFWHSLSSDNLGERALAQSELLIINNAAAEAGVEVRYYLFGADKNLRDDVWKGLVEKTCLLSTRRMIRGGLSVLEMIKECNIIVDIGAGDSFSDIYGFKRFLKQLISKGLVLLLRKPLVLAPQTIGPYGSVISAKLANWIMKRCTRVYARDALSYDYLQQNNVIMNSDISTDVAMRLPYKSTVNYGSKKEVSIGLNVSGLLYNGGYNRSNMFHLSVDYKHLIHVILDTLTKLNACEVFLVPHVISAEFPIEDDYAVCEQLSKQFPSAKLTRKFDSPSEAKSFISTLDFFIGSRMHACIAAFSSGVPVIPLAYSRKFEGLFSSLNYTYVCNCGKLNEDDIMRKILDGLRRRKDLRKQVALGNVIAKERLSRYETFVSALLRNNDGKTRLN